MQRLRRLRSSEKIRELVSQTKLSANNLIMPYFVVEGKNKKEPIISMPGINRLSIDNLTVDIEEAYDLGIKAMLLFGISPKKDIFGLEAYRQDGIVQKAIRAVKRKIKDIVVISDVCLCGYTTHGHCGVVKNQNYEIDNDKTIKTLSKIALSHTEAGVDFVAPSAMMDGQVEAIRTVLDKKGFIDTGIFAYSAKFASNFYGPFREALDSAPQFGDRKGYQLDFRNSAEALREIGQDIAEGADIVMVKPALAYLDIICRAKEKFNISLAAYNVSGEYAMIKALSRCSVFGVRCSAKTANRKPITETEQALVLEILTAIKRAGADLIISYHAKEAAKWLRH